MKENLKIIWFLGVHYKEGSLAQSWAETIIVPSRYRSTFSFPFKRFLFCHILPIKTVAMENTQWRWHCEYRHSSSSDNYVFSPKRLQFSRRQYKQTGREGGKHAKRAHSNFNQRRRPWGWLTKWRKKNSFIVEEARQFAVTMTWPERGGGGSITVMLSTCSEPTESLSCLFRWTCWSQLCI